MNQFTNISPKKFAQLNPKPLLIDVRSRLEYKSGHAPQAENLSLPRLMLGQLPILSKIMLPKWFRELPKTEPIAVICLTAHRSPIAANQLTKAGFHKVINITGGMMEWRSKNLDIIQE
jgi:rhodanese-related sulfurtransferase